MTGSDDLRRENRALRERIAALHAAILRINASLELETVLGAAVESARALTGARYGIITTIDETGAHRGSAYSGFSAEQRREMAALPGKVRLFEHLRDLPGPLRVANLSGYMRSLVVTTQDLVPCDCGRRRNWQRDHQDSGWNPDRRCCRAESAGSRHQETPVQPERSRHPFVAEAQAGSDLPPLAKRVGREQTVPRLGHGSWHPGTAVGSDVANSA